MCIVLMNVRFKSKKKVFLFNSTDVKVPLMIANQPTDISDKLGTAQPAEKREVETGIAGQCRINKKPTVPD
jgi:hypothetical protein